MKVTDLKVGDFIRDDKEVMEITEIDQAQKYFDFRCRSFHEDGTQVTSSGTCSFQYMEAHKDSFEFLGHKNVFFVSDMRAIIEYKARLDAAGAEWGAMLVDDEGDQVVCPADVWDEFFEGRK